MANTNAKSKFFIGPTGTGTVAADYTGAGVTYTEVKDITDLGSLGDEAEVVSFKTLGDGRTKKLPGSRDAGTLEVTVARDKADAGQSAMRTASADDAAHKFKCVLSDGTAFYFSGIVLSAKNELGDADNVVSTVFSVAINTAILETAAA